LGGGSPRELRFQILQDAYTLLFAGDGGWFAKPSQHAKRAFSPSKKLWIKKGIFCGYFGEWGGLVEKKKKNKEKKDKKKKKKKKRKKQKKTIV